MKTTWLSPPSDLKAGDLVRVSDLPFALDGFMEVAEPGAVLKEGCVSVTLKAYLRADAEVTRKQRL